MFCDPPLNAEQQEQHTDKKAECVVKGGDVFHRSTNNYNKNIHMKKK